MKLHHLFETRKPIDDILVSALSDEDIDFVLDIVEIALRKTFKISYSSIDQDYGIRTLEAEMFLFSGNPKTKDEFALQEIGRLFGQIHYEKGYWFSDILYFDITKNSVVSQESETTPEEFISKMRKLQDVQRQLYDEKKASMNKSIQNETR